jgi:hypothetical protein
MSEYRTRSTSYYCTKVSSNVKITCDYLIHYNSSGEIDLESPTSFECDKYLECGVVEKSGIATNYNWEKCIHPFSH